MSAPAAPTPSSPAASGPHPRLPGVRVGCDVQGVEAVEQALAHFGDRYLDRVYTATEQTDCRGMAASLAGRFAAKEAVLKLLGRADGIDPRTVEVLSGPGGRPTVLLHDQAVALAAACGVETLDVSISHDSGIALAVAVAVPTDHPTPSGETP